MRRYRVVEKRSYRLLRKRLERWGIKKIDLGRPWGGGAFIEFRTEQIKEGRLVSQFRDHAMQAVIVTRFDWQGPVHTKPTRRNDKEKRVRKRSR